MSTLIKKLKLKKEWIKGQEINAERKRAAV